MHNVGETLHDLPEAISRPRNFCRAGHSQRVFRLVPAGGCGINPSSCALPDALETQLSEVEAWIAPIRREFGNPFFYSGPAHARPENAAKSATHYTGQASHEVVFQLLSPIIVRLQEVTREVIAIRQRLRGLGHEVE